MKTHKPLVIGLTGGIAAGKTTVSQLFEKWGAPIIDADVIAHQLTAKNTAAYKDICLHFGDSILQKDGTLDRLKLRNIIFHNPVDKAWLEQLLHPRIREKMKVDVAAVKTPYCICVIPLLAEGTGIDFLDRVLVVDADPKIQLSRLTTRDQSSESLAQKILLAQAAREKRLAIADDIIDNNGDPTSLERQVKKLHERYTALHEKSMC